VVLALKLFLTPFFIAMVSLAGRKWGPGISGWLMGLPLTSAPVSIILASQYGTAFAAHAAVGSLGGQVSVCIFCLVYSMASRKLGWTASSAAGILAFLASTFFWSHFSLSLLPALLILLGTIGLVSRLIPASPTTHGSTRLPNWDLPARMTLAALFVYLLTTFASFLGPQLSGLISPFPVFGVILAAFTHRQQGSKAAADLLRGNVAGSLGFACFFGVVAFWLPGMGILPTYLAATAAAVSLNGITLYFSR
jgi:hypothetical protein